MKEACQWFVAMALNGASVFNSKQAFTCSFMMLLSSCPIYDFLQASGRDRLIRREDEDRNDRVGKMRNSENEVKSDIWLTRQAKERRGMERVEGRHRIVLKSYFPKHRCVMENVLKNPGWGKDEVDRAESLV